MESIGELESLIIGSGPEARIQIEDSAVSSMHLLIKRDREGTVRAIDLGSEGGTQLWDFPVQGPAALTSGDVLRIGNTRIKVLFGEPPKPQSLDNLVTLDTVRARAKRSVSLRHPSAGGAEAILLSDPLPPELAPTEHCKVLQVALFWGETLINVRHFGDRSAVRIGEGEENVFQVFSPSVGESMVLARPNGPTIRLQVPADASLIATESGARRTKEQLRAEGRLRASDREALVESIEIGLGESARVSLGNVSFMVRYVRPSAAAGVQVLDSSDLSFFKIAVICAVAVVLLLIAVLLTPPPPIRAADDISRNQAKYVKLLIQPERRVELEKMRKARGSPEGAKASDKEGKFGKPEAKKEEAEPSKKGSPIVDPNKREQDRRKVMSAGLLGALKRDGASSNIFGPGGLGTGVNDALGGLRSGAGAGTMRGVGGLGSRGSGVGGGGTGLGLGGLGTKGTGPGAGGYGGIDLGVRGKETTRVIPGRTVVVGGLSRDVIAKIIRSHQHEIKYCYEVELQKNAALAGKVAVLFTIDSTGAVSEAKVSESSLGNRATEQCMLSRIQRWKFPEPEGGGVVTVAFPWIFKPVGVDAKTD
jgi:TonB family protein